MRQPRYRKPKVAPAPALPIEVGPTKVTSRPKPRDTTRVPLTPAQKRLAEAVKFQMVLDPDVAAKIEQLRQWPERVSRRHWIRMAIAEKIARDS